MADWPGGLDSKGVLVDRAAVQLVASSPVEGKDALGH